MILNPIISEQIRTEHDRLAEAGEVLPEEQLASYYRLFREKFGPERLARMDGESLLNLMHNSSDQGSMVYWLGVKNDEEFPNRFGSIAGGSPLKFGLFRHRETGLWTTGTPQKQVSLSVEQAVEIAYKHRNQLLKGCELLGDLPLNAGNEQYAKLDKDLNEQAPGISNVSWAHKYFSLLFPDKLEDYHSPDYQRFHLIKMLQMPVAPEGRYSVAGQYMAIACELGMHINNLTRALNAINGKPYQYWVVDIRSAKSLMQWDDMLETGYLGIGWDKLGNLSHIKRSNAPSNQVKSLMLDHYKQDARFARDIFSFVTKLRVGDVISSEQHIWCRYG